MVDTLNGVIIGTELAVFFVILIYVVLLDMTSKSKMHRSINIFAGSLIIVSGMKFFIVLLEIKPAFAIEATIGLLSLAAGLGLISFLSYISKSIEDYR